MKIIITKKEHICGICYKKIEKGSLAVVGTEVVAYKGMTHYLRPRLRHRRERVYYHIVCALEKGLITKENLEKFSR